MNPTVKQLSIQDLVKIFTLLTGIVSSVVAHGAERQSLQSIRDAVSDFVATEHDHDDALQVKTDRLDPRLRLAPCAQPLLAFWSPGSKMVGNTTVGVRCEGKRPWKLFVPTRVMLMRDVVVSSRPLARGQLIDKGDLKLEARDLGRLRRSAVYDPAQVLGYVLKRALASGKVLDAAMLEAPILVQRGRSVRMAIRARGLSLSMTGKAMENGALGETVRIQNSASKAIVEGVVTGPGTVRLHLARKRTLAVNKN